MPVLPLNGEQIGWISSNNHHIAVRFIDKASIGGHGEKDWT